MARHADGWDDPGELAIAWDDGASHDTPAEDTTTAGSYGGSVAGIE